MDGTYVLVAVIVLVIFFVVRHIRVKRRESRLSAPGRTDEAVTVTEGEEEDSKNEPELIEMGDCTVYPLCPKCEKEMKNMLVLTDLGLEDFPYEYVYVLMCPHCKVFLGTMEMQA